MSADADLRVPDWIAETQVRTPLAAYIPPTGEDHPARQKAEAWNGEIAGAQDFNRGVKNASFYAADTLDGRAYRAGWQKARIAGEAAAEPVEASKPRPEAGPLPAKPPETSPEPSGGLAEPEAEKPKREPPAPKPKQMDLFG